MDKWKHNLNFKDLWEAREAEDPITIGQLAEKVAQRIKKAPFYEKYEADLEEIVQQFEGIGEDPEFDDVDEFDWVLKELYDWADENRCWINTHF